MSNDKKNIDNKMNTEIDQALSVINFTEFTQIDQPKTRRIKIKIFSLGFLFISLLLGAVYFFQEGSSLANHLPADTKFYVSLSLPAENIWYSPFLFWQSGNKPDRKITSIYSRLNLISWEKVSWQEKILPLLSERIELASLPSKDTALLSASNPQRISSQASDGGLLLRARLSDKAAWLALFGSTPESYQGEVVSQDLTVSGAWAALTKNPNKISWQILGHNLYLSDNPGILLELNSKISNSLYSELKKAKVNPGLALIYVKDKDSLLLDNVYVKSLAGAAAYPLVIGLVQEPGALKFDVYGQKINSEPIKSTALAERLNDFDSAFYGQNLAALYPPAEEHLPDGLEYSFWPILKDFYGIDKAEALTEIGASEIFLTFSGSDWLLNIANNNAENNNLLAVLKKAGQAGFAITHPQAVERKLADGSKMTELRADTEGLEWQNETWPLPGQLINLESLKGQGEESGYYAGFAPGIGYILTTSMSLLNRYEQMSAEAVGKISKTGCAAPNNMLMGASLSVNNLTNDAWWRSLAKKIIITMPSSDKISGCVVLGG